MPRKWWNISLAVCQTDCKAFKPIDRAYFHTIPLSRHFILFLFVAEKLCIATLNEHFVQSHRSFGDTTHTIFPFESCNLRSHARSPHFQRISRRGEQKKNWVTFIKENGNCRLLAKRFSWAKSVWIAHSDEVEAIIYWVTHKVQRTHLWTKSFSSMCMWLIKCLMIVSHFPECETWFFGCEWDFKYATNRLPC